MIGLRPERLLDYVRFEALATSLGLDTALRISLADRFRTGAIDRHECKNALRETYKDGDAKVETQKTRDSGAGRKYSYDSFDIVAACMFSVTGRWIFRFKWTRDLVPWSIDPTRIGAIQRIDTTWATSLPQILSESSTGPIPPSKGGERRAT